MLFQNWNNDKFLHANPPENIYFRRFFHATYSPNTSIFWIIAPFRWCFSIRINRTGIHLFQTYHTSFPTKKRKKDQKTRKIIHPKLLEKLPEITRNYAIPRTRIKRRGGTWRRGEKKKEKRKKNKRQLWKTVRNWSGATRSAASFASNDIACAPKSMVKQFAGHLHDILMQFAWVRGSGARTTRESIHPIFPTLHRGFIVSSCVHEDVDRGYTIFRIDYRILWSIIPSCNIFSRINCKPKIDQFWFQRRRRWMYKCET